MQGKRIKLIDTPGFCDDNDTEEEHMNEFGEAVMLTSKGVNAIGLVINAGERYGTNERSTIDKLSQFQELWPYMFIIFTHARALGITEKDQNKQLQSNFKEPRCPESLKDLMQKVDNRYILVESIKPSDNPEEYYQRKTKELGTMINSIYEANGFQSYTNELFRRAKAILDKLTKELTEEKDEVTKELKMIRSQTDENIKKRMEDEIAQQKAKQQIQIAEEKQKQIEKETDERRKSFLSSTQEEVMQKQKEKEEAKKELDKQYLEKQQLEKKLAEDEEKRQIKQQAVENLKKQIEEERKQHEALKNEELKEKPTKKWYNFLYKKPKEINN